MIKVLEAFDHEQGSRSRAILPDGTTLCDDLASRGYLVVTVDHTYDATAVQFPGGRVEKTVLPAEFAKAYPDGSRITALLTKTLAVRMADTRFVLDELPRVLPWDMRGALDLARVGMYGHWAGGFTTLQTMHDDPRITAGANLDGVLAYVQEDSDPGNLSSVSTDDRPFLLIGKDGNDRRTVPSWDALWQHSPGWHRGLTLPGAEHATYTDAEPVIPQIARGLGLPRKTVIENIGTIAPGRAIAAVRAWRSNGARPRRGGVAEASPARAGRHSRRLALPAAHHLAAGHHEAGLQGSVIILAGSRGERRTLHETSKCSIV